MVIGKLMICNMPTRIVFHQGERWCVDIYSDSVNVLSSLLLDSVMGMSNSDRRKGVELTTSGYRLGMIASCIFLPPILTSDEKPSSVSIFPDVLSGTV